MTWFGGNVVGEVVVVVADELAPVAFAVAGLEFVGGGVDGFEEGGGDAGEGGGGFGIEAAFGDGAEDAGEGMGERGGGNEVVFERLGDGGGGLVDFAEMTKFAFVMDAVLGFFGMAEHAALAAVGEGEGAERVAAIGVFGWRAGILDGQIGSGGRGGEELLGGRSRGDGGSRGRLGRVDGEGGGDFLAEVLESALVVETECGFAGMARGAAMTAVGEGEGTELC